MALDHPSPSPPILTYWKRSTEDAIVSNVTSPGMLRKIYWHYYISIGAAQLATVPLSPLHMPAYAKKWKGSFSIINSYDYQATLNVCYQTQVAFSTT
ncbi:hypothetical protein FGIG_04158 [Fasciola gigantica]|uniref:Uncharacterized protein n=1 Tax=Fasciola gigantica TaxID=46835 RepID=A0A504YQ38_FASGI|nr:hypothetical protein FGIG_04158 [Fasciola gigantica]